MMELADMRDLGSRGVIRWGSSPHARTKAPKVQTFGALVRQRVEKPFSTR